MDESKITHKELLTFSNLTNLEWEFVDFKAIKEGGREGREDDGEENIYTNVSTQLNDLLTPEVFTRRDAEGDIEKFVYMEGIESSEIEKIEEGQREIKAKEKEQGLVEMRQKAGIAMEYLEKSEASNEEGDFLEEWEVIYGADSYEIIAGYLDSLWGLICSQNHELDEDKKIYPEREDIESNKEDKARVEFAINLATMTLSIATADVSKSATEISLSSILKTVASGQLQSQAEEKHVALAFGVALIFNFNDPLGLLEDSLDSSEELFITTLSEEFEETIEFLEENNDLEQELEINFTEEFDMSQMSNDDFRLLALKKDNEIVIVNQSKSDDDRDLLPKELDLLQMAFTKLRADNSDDKISFTFTGFERGADLSFVNTLLYADEADSQAKLFYNSIDGLKNYLNFTPENINEEYKSLREIKVSGLYNAPNEAMSRFLGVSIAKALRFCYTKLMGKTVGGITLTATALSLAALKLFVLSILIAAFSLVIGGIITWVESRRVRKIYNHFKEFDMIKEEQNGIKGYFTDDFIDDNYVVLDKLLKIRSLKNTDLLNEQDSLTDVDFKKIKIKKEDLASMLLKFSEIEEFKVNKVTEDIILQNDIEYEIKIKASLDIIDRPGDSAAMELAGHPPYNGLKRSEYSLGLKKDDESDIYRIVAEIVREDPPPALYTPVNFIKSNDEMLLQGRLLTNLMEIIAQMQRNYQDKEAELFEFIYTTDNDKEAERIKLSNEIPDSDEVFQARDYNEHIFMPYLDESGQIGDGLREEYLKKVVKNIILRSEFLGDNAKGWLNRQLNNVKYNPFAKKENGKSFNVKENYIRLKNNDSIEVKSSREFVEETEDKEEYKEKIEAALAEYIGDYINSECFGDRDHSTTNSGIDTPLHLSRIWIYRQEREIIKEKLLEKIEAGELGDYYELKIDEARFVLPIITIGSKDDLEYKYNPEDNMLGGVLKIQDPSFKNLYQAKEEELVEDIGQEIELRELLALRSKTEHEDIDRWLEELGYDIEKLELIEEISASSEDDLSKAHRNEAILEAIQESYQREKMGLNSHFFTRSTGNI